MPIAYKEMREKADAICAKADDVIRRCDVLSTKIANELARPDNTLAPSDLNLAIKPK